MQLSEFELDLASKISVLEVNSPPLRKGGVIVKDVDELIDKLRNEAKII